MSKPTNFTGVVSVEVATLPLAQVFAQEPDFAGAWLTTLTAVAEVVAAATFPGAAFLQAAAWAQDYSPKIHRFHWLNADAETG